MLTSRLIPAALLLLATPAAQAQKLPNNPQAVALLTQMVRTYQNLKSYSATETAEGAASGPRPFLLVLTYARPDRVDLEVTRTENGRPVVLRIVSDGMNYFSSNSLYPKRYLKTIAPQGKSILGEALLDAHIQAEFIPSVLEHGDSVLKYLTDSANGSYLSMDKPAILDGVAVDTILMQLKGQNPSSAIPFQIGHADHLLRRNASPDDNVVETYTHVQADPALAASAFAFVPTPAALAAAPATAAKPDPKAVALVAGMYAAYDALHSFSCTMNLVASFPSHDVKGNALGTRSIRTRATYIVQKPNKIAFTRTSEQGSTQAVCDGHFLYARTTEDKGGLEEFYAHPRYLRKVAPDGTERDGKL